MAGTGTFRGVNIRQSGTEIVFRAGLTDSSGNDITSGTTTLALYELQSDGTLKSFDWSDFTFKTTALTTATRSMTHQKGNNNSTNTGIWTATLLATEGSSTGLNAFTRGNIYFAIVNNSSAFPLNQKREFQYGEGEGDHTVDSSGRQVIQPTGLDAITYADVSGRASTFSDMVRQIWAWFYNRVVQTSTTQTVYESDSTTPSVSGTVSDDGTTAVKGKLS